MEETLYDKATHNLKIAELIIKEATDDEAYLNYAGYHLQQAVELSIKFVLEENGIEYPYTHDITQLIYACKENNVSDGFTDYVDEHSEMFTIWESKTRYVTNYNLEAEKVKRAAKEVEAQLELIQINYIKIQGKDV